MPASLSGGIGKAHEAVPLETACESMKIGRPGSVEPMLRGCAGLAVLGVLAAGCSSSGDEQQARTPQVPTQTSTVTLAEPAKVEPARTAERKRPTFADIVARLRSGVVRIEIKTCDGDGVGTGFLVGPRLIATVEHVVNGATEITVKRAGKTLTTATVVGQDVARDIALLRTNTRIAGHHFGLANTTPRLGEDVAALGFPLGLPLTVTRGSVSGLDRTIPIEGIKRRRLVQTDAAINQGNSGGPLFLPESGQVVGLVDLVGNEVNGIAFAVSAEVAKPLLQAWRVAPQPVSATTCLDDEEEQVAAPHTQEEPSASDTNTEHFAGRDFTLNYPAGWQIETAEVDKGGYIDTTIRDPGQP